MNGYTISRDYFDWAFENPELVSSNETAMMFWITEAWNRCGQKEKFTLPASETMQAIGIKNYKTYKKTLNNLLGWGFIRMVQESRNQYTANIIALVENDKANGKALSKAMNRQQPKHSQPNATILNHNNKKTLNPKNFENKKVAEANQQPVDPAAPSTAISKTISKKFTVPKQHWDLFVTHYNDFLKGRGLPEIMRYPDKESTAYDLQAKVLHDLKLIYKVFYELDGITGDHDKVCLTFQAMFTKWHLLNKFTQDMIQPEQLYKFLPNIIDQLKNFKSRNMTVAQKKTEEAWNNINPQKLLNNGK